MSSSVSNKMIRDLTWDNRSMDESHSAQQVLTKDERETLISINHLLYQLTEKHHCMCCCELCEARAMTDVQEESSFTVNYLADDLPTTAAEDLPGNLGASKNLGARQGV